MSIHIHTYICVLCYYYYHLLVTFWAWLMNLPASWCRSGKVNPQFPYLLHLGIQVLYPVSYFTQVERKKIAFFFFSWWLHVSVIFVVLTTFYIVQWTYNSVLNFLGQSYDSNFLKIYPGLHPTPLQLEEDLEQLKVLENGYKMKVQQTYFTIFLPGWNFVLATP